MKVFILEKAVLCVAELWNCSQLHGPFIPHVGMFNNLASSCTCEITKSQDPSCQASSYAFVSDHSGYRSVSVLWGTTGSYSMSYGHLLTQGVCDNVTVWKKDWKKQRWLLKRFTWMLLASATSEPESIEEHWRIFSMEKLFSLFVWLALVSVWLSSNNKSSDAVMLQI